MKTIKSWYNPAQRKIKNQSHISLTSLFSWLTVLMVIVLFWTAIAVAYKRDYVPQAITKVENKEKRFLAAHKTIVKKPGGTHSFI